MNNIEHIKPLGKDGRYHITDLKIGDIAYLNGVEGKLTLEGDRIVFVETGAFSGKWTINPTAEGWISDITGVKRPFDARLKRAIRRIEQRDRRITGLERRISMLEGVVAETQVRKHAAKQGMPSDIRIVYLVNAITDALREMDKRPGDSVSDIWNEKLEDWSTGFRMDHNYRIDPVE